MGNLARNVFLTLVTAVLAGCTPVQSQIDQAAERATGAEPLATQYPACVGTPTCTAGQYDYSSITDDTVAKKWIGEAAADSVTKCMAFLARMSAGQTVTNTALDITAIGLAGAGAITIPLRSAQTLAALAGITTATKAAISSDVFAQNAAPVIAQKIMSTYMAEMRTFLTQTGTVTAATLPTAYTQLLTNHFDCSLTAALATLGTGTATNASKIPLSSTAMTQGAVIVDPTAKLSYVVTSPYSSSTGMVSVATVGIGTTIPANPTGTATSATQLLNTLNADGAFVLTPGTS